MNTTIRYVVLTAIRDWLFVAILGALVIAVFLSHFLASTVLIEKEQMLSSFTASSARLVLVVGMIVFICFNVRRAFENKEIDLMLSRPISRASFIFSYWIGFSVVALAMLSALGLYMAFFYKYNYVGLSIWISSMAFEIFIVTAFSLFAAVILKSSVSAVLLSFGFYIVSRLVGFFSYAIDRYSNLDFKTFDFYSQKIIWLISYLMPRLDLFAQSKWLVYGADLVNTDWQIPILQSLIYIPLLLSMAIIDFTRKQF